MPLARVKLRKWTSHSVAFFLPILFIGCKSSSGTTPHSPDVRVNLAKYGLPRDYSRHDDDIACTAHVIGYRSIVWLSSNRIALVFNVSPSCRPSSEERVTTGVARLLVFDLSGNLKASRDISYDADGGEEIVAPGEAMLGPDNTLLFRIEEAGGSKSGVRLFDEDLKDVARLDRFMETGSVIDHSLVFQEGTVWSGPRTYDIFDGRPLVQVNQITQDWPTGAMDRRIGRHGLAYMLCMQQLGPNNYRSTNVIYANVHRRCVMTAQNFDGATWDVQLKQDEVGELTGILDDGGVVGIVRGPHKSDRLLIWRKNQTPETLPWFPTAYDATLQGEAGDMNRYQGYGIEPESKLCGMTNMFCHENADGRLMIFDQASQVPLVDRRLARSARAALSLDGLRYATLESGEFRIYSLPRKK
jgi:hypothetical protein